MHLERRSLEHIRIYNWHVTGEARRRRIGRSPEYTRPRLRHVAVVHAIADPELRRVRRDKKTLTVEGMAGSRHEGFARPVDRLENVELRPHWGPVLVKLSVVAVVHVLGFFGCWVLSLNHRTIFHSHDITFHFCLRHKSPELFELRCFPERRIARAISSVPIRTLSVTFPFSYEFNSHLLAPAQADSVESLIFLLLGQRHVFRPVLSDVTKPLESELSFPGTC